MLSHQAIRRIEFVQDEAMRSSPLVRWGEGKE